MLPAADARTVTVVPDALVVVGDGGRILSAGPTPADCRLPETRPGAVWLPGFVDAHVHSPQTRVGGSATGPLLEWLATTVFPEEARFAERTYAEVVAAEFVDSLVRWGTTSASVFSSSHPEATELLFGEMARRGLRGHVGLTLMDRGAPPELLLGADEALEAARSLAERWDGYEGRLRFSVTPRFALSCTPALLRGAGALAAELGLPVQTHLSENRIEIAETCAAFPDSRDYLAVYADHGLLGPRSLFAHCIWLDDDAWGRMAAASAAVAHCPDSNFFLGSGCMDLAAAHRHGVRVGLGTDVGAGRTFSLRRIAARAYDVALVREAQVDPAELLWLATVGGARALGMTDVGELAPGFAADLVAFDVPAHIDDGALLDWLCFGLDAGPAAEVYVNGVSVHR